MPRESLNPTNGILWQMDLIEALANRKMAAARPDWSRNPRAICYVGGYVLPDIMLVVVVEGGASKK